MIIRWNLFQLRNQIVDSEVEWRLLYNKLISVIFCHKNRTMKNEEKEISIQIKSALLVILILSIPSTLFAGYEIKTGYDLYRNINLIDNPLSNKDAIAGIHVMGYMAGFIDGLALTQDIMFNMMFPKNRFSEKEIQELSKKVNLHRLNLPKEGLPAGQAILIYKKYAEKHPERHNDSARICIFTSLVEAYGWR